MTKLSEPQQPPEIPHLQPSIEAAARVRSCHPYISIEPIDDLVVDEQRQLLTNHFLQYGDYSDDHGTSDPILWNPAFEYLKAIHIKPRDPDSTRKPKLVLLFSHSDKMRDKIFGCYRDDQQSLAKVILSKSEDPYPGDTCGRVHINSINSLDRDFRHGSFLIQLAIEYSFQQGYEGRVTLFSTNGSGKFYFKLGFLPKYLTQSNLAALLTELSVDGGDMYLPQVSIDAWKERIVEHPIILSQQEIELLITNHATTVAPDTRCPISMQVLSGFMVILGAAAVAIAFTMLNAATLGTVGATVACIGLASLLTGCGFFKKSCENGQLEASLLPVCGLPINSI